MLYYFLIYYMDKKNSNSLCKNKWNEDLETWLSEKPGEHF